MPKPICVACRKFYKMKRVGVRFIEGKPTVGNINDTVWVPYKLWQGDLWQCKGCGHELISGAGVQPIAEDYDRNFRDKVAASDVVVRVDDC